jgi:hypothetical protein
MDTLQSRLDAEFLLAHMCSVKFKEWIVVLATLLRRAEVIFHIFLFLFLVSIFFSLYGGGVGWGRDMELEGVPCLW